MSNQFSGLAFILTVVCQINTQHISSFTTSAGLAAYPSWVPTLKLLSQQDAPPAIFTDFCEEAAVQAIRVMQAVARGPMQWIPISVNPFRKPLSCQGRDNNLPSYSNAFMFGMAPLDTSE